jgi:hypothetical protein
MTSVEFALRQMYRAGDVDRKAGASSLLHDLKLGSVLGQSVLRR